MSILGRIMYTGAALGVVALALVDHFHDYFIARFQIQHGWFHPAVMSALLTLVFVSIFLTWSQARAEMRKTRLDLAESRKELEFFREKNRALLHSVRAAIHEQYARWGFSPAEVEAADMLILGYSTRQIAALLQKSPGTVRNQTISIYRKAGMTGRNDLAAFFLNEFIGEEDT